MTQPLLITITGPSLSGKSTLERLLLDRGIVEKVTSTTTRTQRQGEINGDAYFFVNPEEFRKKIDEQQMVEHVTFEGNMYGVDRHEVETKFAKGKPVVIVVEPDGARQIKAYAEQNNWKCIQVFVSNPEEVIRARFDERFKNDALAKPEVYAKRWETMKTVERTWREKMAHADFFIDGFDAQNQEEVVSHVTQLIQQANHPKKPKP
jgi:guanylate kinase